jgi:hypothetical protein
VIASPFTANINPGFTPGLGVPSMGIATGFPQTLGTTPTGTTFPAGTGLGFTAILPTPTTTSAPVFVTPGFV